MTHSVIVLGTSVARKNMNPNSIFATTKDKEAIFQIGWVTIQYEHLMARLIHDLSRYGRKQDVEGLLGQRLAEEYDKFLSRKGVPKKTREGMKIALVALIHQRNMLLHGRWRLTMVNQPRLENKKHEGQKKLKDGFRYYKLRVSQLSTFEKKIETVEKKRVLIWLKHNFKT